MQSPPPRRITKVGPSQAVLFHPGMENPGAEFDLREAAVMELSWAMKHSISLALIFTVSAGLLAGCGNNSQTSPQATNAAAPASDSANYLGAMARAQQSAVKTIDTSSIKSAIQLFQAAEGHLPKDLNELVEKKYLPQIPPVPAGMRLDYNPQTGDISAVKQ